MQSQSLQFLHEMGVDYYQLHHPERLAGYQAPSLSLEPNCRLLLVAPHCPTGPYAVLFERVLTSINLSLSDARHIAPYQLSMLGDHQLEWIWFAGCEVEGVFNANVLTSPSLDLIDGNQQHRRALWQQICSYK
ncbi:DNA polymerase III subunit psi [Vibrio sp. JPW-9-11-11]|uniref:DNA polymerase III subunit psi n=1 Tax=Vibrio sp. JPW-9-11-11 TaxID=1416532 RepID=UPI001593EA5C|nr:DNA polymerase III subunit psi [Vibrio sp. JPW-9-11-11]NVD05747.1 DNA polymerase III subunit psi [Vibrio sp. JPW-9-11-11]